MAQRESMNVSLTSTQEQFVRAQVESGQYATASEVVRDGLRLLERAAEQRLLEKWIRDDLGEDEIAQLPPDVVRRVQDHFRNLVNEGIESGEKNGWVDGDTAMNRIRERLHSRVVREP